MTTSETRRTDVRTDLRERIRNAARANLTQRARTRFQKAATAAAVAATAALSAPDIAAILNEEAPPSAKTVHAADLFCGAGGATAGLLQAAKELGWRVEMVAVNHWGQAITTHKANYPKFKHLRMEVAKVDPLKAVPGGYLDLLLAGPECTHHSNARGGKPRNKQSRASAFDIIHWLETLDVRNVIIENVREFLSWGPLDEHNKPIKALKGYYFRLFLECLRELGYTVEHRIVCAADHGDPTTRKRLFILATKTGSPSWPAATHCPAKDVKRFPGRKPWRTAREIIDWELKGTSIYSRTEDGKEELCENTLKRIFAGVRKFWMGAFLVPNFGERDGQAPRAHAVDSPAPAVTSHGAGALVQPMLVIERGTKPEQIERSAHLTEEPAPTLCGGNHVYLAQPYLVNLKGKSDASDIDAPSPTATTSPHLSVAEPQFVLPNLGYYRNNKPYDPGAIPLQTVTSRGGGVVIDSAFLLGTGHKGANGGYTWPVDEYPAPTLTTQPETAVIEPRFLLPHQHGNDGPENTRDIEQPAPTVTATSSDIAVIDTFLVGSGGPEGQGRPISTAEPMRTQLGENHTALIEPSIEPFVYCGFNKRDGTPYEGKPIGEPLPTATAEWNHHGVVEPVIDSILLNYHGSHEGKSDGDGRSQTVDAPLGTLDTANRYALCQFVLSYYGNGQCVATVADPLATVTTKDRFALVELVWTPAGVYEGRVVGWLDILYRMLEPYELARAHSFPEDYVFPDSKTAAVKMIGNSWPVATGAALCKAMLTRPGGTGRALSEIRSGRDPREFILRARRLLDDPAELLAPSLFDFPAAEVPAKPARTRRPA